MNSLYEKNEYISDIKDAILSAKDFDKLQGKTVLITGCTGLIGSFLVEMFCVWNSMSAPQSQIKIIAAGRAVPKIKARFCGLPGEETICPVEYDLMKPISFSNISADYIIHAASNAYPAAFAKTPVDTLMGNVYGTYNLLEYARQNNVERLLYISSGEIYGECDESLIPFQENSYGYVDILNPRSCYPVAKRASENLCISYNKQHGLDVVIARPCHTYGPNITENDNRATVQFTRKAVSNETIIMKSKGAQIRSYCYIADCATALLAILLRGKCCEAYNIANVHSCLSIADFAQLTANLASVNIKYDLTDQQANAQQTFITRAVLSAEKLQSLGWVGKFDPYTGIQHTLNIMKH